MLKKWMKVAEWEEAGKVAHSGTFVGRDLQPSLVDGNPPRDLSPEG